MTDLKLIALDHDDIVVFSAHLQDAILRVADLAWMPRARRFAFVANRFSWDVANSRLDRNERRRVALRFEHVLGVQVQGLDLNAKETVLSLLALQFEETDAPGGVLTLVFAGDGAIRLTVECVEGEIRDLGGSWKTRRRPTHSIVDDDDGDASFNSDT